MADGFFSCNNKNYNINNFRNEMRAIILKCVVEDIKICFILEEYQVVDDQILDDVSSLLTSAEITTLFSSSELEAMLGQLKSKVPDNKTTSLNNQVALTEYMKEQVKRNTPQSTRRKMVRLDLFSIRGVRILRNTFSSFS